LLSSCLFGWVKRGREIALAEVGQDDDDSLAFILRPASNLQGGPSSGSATGAAEQAFASGKLSSDINRVFILDLDHFVDDFDVEDVRYETRADALNGMAPRFDFLA